MRAKEKLRNRLLGKLWNRLLVDDLTKSTFLPGVRVLCGALAIGWALLSLIAITGGSRIPPVWIAMLPNLALLALGLVFSIDGLYEFVRFGTTKEAYVKLAAALASLQDRSVREFTGATEELRSLSREELVMAAICHRTLPGSAGPIQLVARLGSSKELTDLVSLLKQFSKAFENFGVTTFPLEVFTYVDSKLVASKGYDHDWKALSRRLAPDVAEVVSLSRLQWYCVPAPPIPWKCVALTSNWVLACEHADRDVCWRLETAPTLQRVVSSALNEFLATCPRVRVVSAVQILNLQELATALNVSHLYDWSSEGYRFGKFAELTMAKPKQLLEWATSAHAGDLQDKEDKHYRLLAREILEVPCRVTTYWPMGVTSDSLQYAVSKSIAEWQSELIGHLRSHPGASATRYLALSVTNRGGSLRLVDEKVRIAKPDGRVSGDVKYEDLVVAVIAAYFAPARALTNFSLFLVPLRDEFWEPCAQDMRARKATLSDPEMLKSVRVRAFESDWVMFERDGTGGFVVLQFDERLQVGNVRAGGGHLLVHRYGIPDSSFGGCTAPGGGYRECPVSDGLLVPVCCFRQHLRTSSNSTGTYRPTAFDPAKDCFGLWDKVKAKFDSGSLVVPGTPEDGTWSASWEAAWSREIEALEKSARQ